MHTYEEALQSYKMSKNFAYKYLGPDDTMTHNLNDVYEKAKLEIEVKIRKQRNQEEKLNAARQKQRAISASQNKGALKPKTQRRNISGAFSPGGKPRGRPKNSLIGVQQFPGGVGPDGRMMMSPKNQMPLSPTSSQSHAAM